MRQIYWIDDDFTKMICVLQGAIKSLWKLDQIKKNPDDAEPGIASKIIIFGNGRKTADDDKLPTEQEKNDAKQKIFNFFLEECYDLDGPDKSRPVFHAKKDLIKDSLMYLYSEDPKSKKSYLNMKKEWISGELDDSESDSYKKAHKLAKNIYNRMKIKEGSVIGIDISLLFGDLDRLEKNKRILSMELSYIMYKNKLGCFLYSTDADIDILMDNWTNTYKRFYNEESVPQIFHRNQLSPKGNEQYLKSIEEMFKYCVQSG